MKTIKNIRLKNYDYSSDGYYFVTISTDYRRSYLGKYKNTVSSEIDQLNQLPRVTIDYYVIMPNHLHLIIILKDSTLSLGELIRRFKARISKFTKLKLWQPNYYEHVIRNEKALAKIREYIQNNPEKEQINFEQFYK